MKRGYARGGLKSELSAGFGKWLSSNTGKSVTITGNGARLMLMTRDGDKNVI
jgi:hypothetical protein